MLRTKEIQDQISREEEARKVEDLRRNKELIQRQITEGAKLKDEAYQQYTKEKDQVDNVIQKMIDEDREMARITSLKMEQAQADMILSINEKRALQRRQQEMETYENEMVRRYAQQQQERLNQIQAAKNAAEEARDQIFKRLEGEENQRRMEKEF